MTGVNSYQSLDEIISKHNVLTYIAIPRFDPN